MLAIRMQRTGRTKHAMFRVVVQESRVTPSSGRVVAQLGSYDPHAKTTTLVKEKAEFYLNHGAQPSDRVVRLFEREGISLPQWVNKSNDKKRAIRNTDKLRKNRPAQPAEAETASATETTEQPTESDITADTSTSGNPEDK